MFGAMVTQRVDLARMLPKYVALPTTASANMETLKPSTLPLAWFRAICGTLPER